MSKIYLANENLEKIIPKSNTNLSPIRINLWKNGIEIARGFTTLKIIINSKYDFYLDKIISLESFDLLIEMIKDDFGYMV